MTDPTDIHSVISLFSVYLTYQMDGHKPGLYQILNKYILN